MNNILLCCCQLEDLKGKGGFGGAFALGYKELKELKELNRQSKQRANKNTNRIDIYHKRSSSETPLIKGFSV